MQRAATALEQLRSHQRYDIELVDGRDGRDIASFLDDSIRYGRAAYAVVHMIVDKEKE
jgi:signal recognition particle GTPase